MTKHSFRAIKLGSIHLSIHQGLLLKVMGNYCAWYHPQQKAFQDSCPVTISNADLLYIDEQQMIWGITNETELIIHDQNGVPAHGLVLSTTA